MFTLDVLAEYPIKPILQIFSVKDPNPPPISILCSKSNLSLVFILSTPLGIITAFRNEFTHNQNEQRNKVLAGNITNAGYGYVYVDGHWKEKSNGGKVDVKEDSILIIGRENDNGKLKGLLKKWIREYNQDAALFKDEGTTSIVLLKQSGTTKTISNSFSLKKLEIGYTKLRGRGGRSFSFDEEREGLGWLGQMKEKMEKKNADI